MKTMTAEEYVRDLCDPGYPVGYLFLQVEDDARKFGRDSDFVQLVKALLMTRQQNGAVFPFPRGVRYV